MSTPISGHPVIDHERDVAEPVALHEVSGHFDGTDVKFTFSFPLRAQWQGRFFQDVYPLSDESAPDQSLRFGADSGAYIVQTNSQGGYRADAAAALFSRTVAARHYDTSQRIYGYVSGGSGGSFQTIAAMENTENVWDGGVPFIIGDPTSIPNNFFIRALARMVLRDQASRIADAVAPGAAGADPHLGLTQAQVQVLDEITVLGMPLRAWEDSDYVLGVNSSDGLLGFSAQIKVMDPTYVGDFWSRPGYLGSDKSALGAWMRASRINHPATIIRRESAPAGKTAVVLDSMPTTSYGDIVDVSVIGGPGSAAALAGTVNAATRTVEVAGSPEGLRALQPGARVRVDNSWYLALAAYPRYQVPTRDRVDTYDQYRLPDGTPRYPQRPILAGSVISQAVSGGGTHTGAITGKVIAVSNLLDADAFPWHADWYSRQVRSALGTRYDDTFRLWFADHADHIAPGRTARLIDYSGILQQALRDVAAWAETGRAPAPSTQYTMRDGQIEVPPTAAERHGLQPTVQVTAGGSRRVDATVGQPLRLDAEIAVPPSAGSAVEIAWNPTGVGDFEPTRFADPAQASCTVTYSAPGTYFPAVRVSVQRDADPLTPFARIETLGRMRIVVHP